MLHGPLSKIRVLDLTRLLAGPWASQLLGDLGAEVIKVERPSRGDDTRWFPPFLKGPDRKDTRESAFFLAGNRNKKGITVDIAKPEGQMIVRRLAAISDVLIENYKVGDLARYGLDYATLKKLNPRLIYCSITGYGQTGPYSTRPGYDAVFQAVSGLMSVTGEPDDVPGGGPMRIRIPLLDMWGGTYASLAVLGALYQRDQNEGGGQHIDISLLDAAVALVSQPALSYFLTGTAPTREGARAGSGGPVGTFKCSDGYVMITVGNDAQFAAFCDAIHRPDLATDPRFAQILDRDKNKSALFPVLDEILQKWAIKDFVDALVAAQIPVGPINDMAQVFADPQVRHRDVAVPTVHPLGGEIRLVANPIRYSDTPINNYEAPPLLGQHTDEVLGDLLGMTETEISELKKGSVV